MPHPIPRRALNAIRAGIFAPIVVVGALWWHPWPRHGLDRVKHAVDWPTDCAEIATSYGTRYDCPLAEEVAVVECDYLGPGIVYARFPSQAALRENLLRDPPLGATCVMDHEVVVDVLDPGQFPKVCRKLGGHDADGVAGLPEFSLADDRNGARQLWRERRAEARALRANWSAGD
jgi:hypothetical protein